MTGYVFSQELAETVFAHTEGNPFFLTEVISLLAERGELESTAGYRHKHRHNYVDITVRTTPLNQTSK